jgi:hypothetical protein
LWGDDPWARLQAVTDVLDFHVTIAVLNGWTAAGQKLVYGEIWYRAQI